MGPHAAHRFLRRPLAAAVGSAVAAMAPGLAAQAGSASAGPIVEEVVVTANRREQSILDVPYNISAISGEDIERSFTLDNDELFRSIPGVSQIDQGPRNGAQFSSIRIRGLNVDSSALGDFAVPSVATVSTYVNETPVYANLALFDLDRVEVLRGPQGTLYGSGALGGTVKYHLRKPQLGEVEGGISTDISAVDGSDGLGYGAAGTLNIPLGERAALRANLFVRDYAGITDYVNLYELDSNGVPVQPNGLFDRGPDSASYFEDEDSDTFESLYARVSWRVQPNDDVDIVATYIHQDDDIGGRRQPSQGTDGNGVAYGDYDNGAVIAEPSDREFRMASLEANIDFGFATLTSATSYYDNDGSSETDNTGFYANNFAGFYYNYPRPLYTAEREFNDSAVVQELRLVSNGGNTFDWVVGVFFQDQERSTTQVSDLVGFEAFADALFPPVDFVFTDNVFTFDRREEFTDLAAFGELTWNLSDRVHLTGGVRWFENEFDVDTFVRAGVYDAFNGSASTPFDNTDSDILLKGNLAIDFGDDDLAYLTVSEGYRRGGNNGVPTIGRFANDPAWQLYQSDTVVNYEIGVKGRLAGQRYDLSLFYIDWQDPQFNTSAPNGAFFAVVNGDEAATQGLELQVTGNLTDRLRYAFGYAYVDAELTEDLVEPIDIATGLPTTIATDGAPLPGIPEHAINVAIDYLVPLNADRQLALRLDGFYQSKTQNVLDEGILQSDEFDGFSIFDASIAYLANNWSAALFVKNLANEEGVTGAFTAGAFGPVVDLAVPLASAEFYGSNAREFITLPRTLGFSLRYDF